MREICGAKLVLFGGFLLLLLFLLQLFTVSMEDDNCCDSISMSIEIYWTQQQINNHYHNDNSDGDNEGGVFQI